MILIQQYPHMPHRPERQKEFAYCLGANSENPHITKIVLLQEAGAMVPVSSNKILVKGPYPRLRYIDAVLEADHYCGEPCIIANADITFDDTLVLVTREKLFETVICLSRQDMVEKMFEGQPAARVSQDAWIFMSPLSNVTRMNLDVELGRPGCDNRVAAEFGKVYGLANPSRQIKCWHHHGGIRAGTFVEGAGPVDEPGNMERDRIPGPYRWVPITENW